MRLFGYSLRLIPKDHKVGHFIPATVDGGGDPAQAGSREKLMADRANDNLPDPAQSAVKETTKPLSRVQRRLLKPPLLLFGHAIKASEEPL
jgi:hypothetical protein